MTSQNSLWIGLLRAIGPATHKPMPMSKLREACESAGLGEVRTILATGNLIFTSAEPETHLHQVLTATIRSFGLANAVFLRRPRDIQRIVAANPFRDATRHRPNKVIVLFLDKGLGPEAISSIRNQPGPEHIEFTDREMFIDYVNPIAESKLTPAFIERLIGMSATARNWNTLMRLRAISE